MQIIDFLPQSVIDYPEKICSVIFVAPCNFRCGFCHNPELVFENKEKMDQDFILHVIKEQKKLIDSVTITGGEPTLQSDLDEFMMKLKFLDISIKLDTNGSNPDVIKKLLDNNLLDYIAMDVKTSLDKYDKAVGVKVNKEKIKESINIIKNSKIEYEFRTTVVPTLVDKNTIEQIAKEIKDSNLYVLQQFFNKKTLDPSYNNIVSYTNEELEKLSEIAKRYVKKVVIKN